MSAKYIATAIKAPAITIAKNIGTTGTEELCFGLGGCASFGLGFSAGGGTGSGGLISTTGGGAASECDPVFSAVGCSAAPSASPFGGGLTSSIFVMLYFSTGNTNPNDITSYLLLLT